jgi:phosphatidylglycerophosphatase A
MSNSASTVTAASPARRKPRISLAIATALGLGYIPKAPGTFGSLAGVALAVAWPCVLVPAFWKTGIRPPTVDLYWHSLYFVVSASFFQIALLLAIAIVGVWAASRAAAYLGAKDPQIIVIDEVSGQYLTLLIGGLWPGRFEELHNLDGAHSLGNLGALPLNWKCVLAGFILFRVFDIWKPFPARQAESLPRGWGIMADDWIAGVYAGLGVLLLRAVGL